jgi:hypothetical protein
MTFDSISSAAEKYFSVISPDKSNVRVIEDTLEVEKLRELVMERLKKLECCSEGLSWWKDKELMTAFHKLFMTGVILLPFNSVERVRWIALVCIAISERENFSYEGILIPADYLPDEELYNLQYEYGAIAIAQVIKFHNKVARKGWGSLLE